MTIGRSTTRPDGRRASRAEIEALETVVAATAAVADQARSEAAATLLRRALALLRDHAAAQLEGGAEETDVFSRS